MGRRVMRPLLYELSPDDALLRRLGEFGGASPAVSPDGSRVAFTVVGRPPPPTLGRWKVFVFERATGTVTSVATGRGPRHPISITWSPGGDRIAFAANRGVVVAEVGGGPLATVRGTRRGDGHPTWSPKADAIAFARPRRIRKNGYLEGTSDLMIVKLRAGRVRRIARNARMPDWSPDGRRIAYASVWLPPAPVTLIGEHLVRGTIWTIRPDGSNRLRLTRRRGEDAAEPKWSPDGRAIAYLSDRAFSRIQGEDRLIILITNRGQEHRALKMPTDLTGAIDWGATG